MKGMEVSPGMVQEALFDLSEGTARKVRGQHQAYRLLPPEKPEQLTLGVAS